MIRLGKSIVSTQVPDATNAADVTIIEDKKEELVEKLVEPAVQKVRKPRKSKNSAGPLERKVVITTKYGCFGLSKKAFERMVELENKYAQAHQKAREASPKHFKDDTSYSFAIPRDDLDLVHVVEKMGAAAAGTYAELKVITIPANVGWQVVEYNGREQIEEAHRIWL